MSSRQRTYNLSDLFRIVVETKPDAEALVCGARRLSFRQLEERATRLALWLRGRGIGAGDTIGIHAYSCAEYVEICLAAFKLKALPANVNYRYTAEEARYIYDNAQLKALIYSVELEDVVRDALPAAPGITAIARLHAAEGQASGIPGAVEYETALAGATGSLDDIELSDDDQILLYTGGTTGMPKGVIWPHKALFYAGFGGGGNFHPGGPIASPEELASRVEEGFYMKLLPTAPLMHGAGLWATLIGLYAGHTVHLNDQAGFDAEHILDKIVAEGISCIMIVGDAMGLPLLAVLRAHPGRWDLSSLMAISSSGALLSDHVQKGLAEFLPPYTRLVIAMGSSETGQSGTGARPATEGLISLPKNATTDVAIEEAPGRWRFARPGEMGILVRLGHLPLGYFRDPQKTAATFTEIEGRRCSISGDIARLEEDDSITVFGRDSQCINTGGEKVYTEEVEEALRSYAGVTDAVVVGIPDERWGNKVVGVVALDAQQTPDAQALRDHARQHIAGYKVPKDIVFVEKVFRNPVGKPDYRWAKRIAEEKLRA
ncbi:Long-chain-fatty-acid--CoA ligase [Sterolibacterium denitrificans]|uniref:Long-chain-fatty-acid--CoA ligase n=1 Tax=Sterolibacterium denitrificans TaxID=157592 RepID=A0A7Z7HPC8_9PROT|nr:AMP-binding protein [Sterolibacterium denitrificans]SMB22529.1 Long-chain-fatty-acid--CoA ligase [Sterolibacterium denitrificans]